MGGCATKPKDLNRTPASLPGENPTNNEPTVKNVEDKTTAQENNNGGEGQKEEPLVDLSEPNPEGANKDRDVPAEPKSAITDLVKGVDEPANVDHVPAKQTKENVGAGNETKEQIKDEPGVADLRGKTKETRKSDAAGNKQELNSVSLVEKGDPPIVSV